MANDQQLGAGRLNWRSVCLGRTTPRTTSTPENATILQTCIPIYKVGI